MQGGRKEFGYLIKGALAISDRFKAGDYAPNDCEARNVHTYATISRVTVVQ